MYGRSHSRVNASCSSCSKVGTLSSVLMYLTPSSASRLGPTFSGSPLFTLNDLPRNVAAPVSGVICLLTDEEMPSFSSKNAG